MIWPHCEADRLVSTISKNETYVVRGKKVTAKVKILKCQHCGNEYTTFPMEEKNLSAFKMKRGNK